MCLLWGVYVSVIFLSVDLSEAFAPRPTLHSDSQTSFDPPPSQSTNQVDSAEGTEGLRDGGSMTDKDSVLDSVLEEDRVVFGDGEC